MTREEAIRILDPETTGEAMAEIEYYGGFSGRAAVVQAVLDACVLAVAALREQEERRWIPVTERLPEDDEQLEFYDNGRMRLTTVLAYTECGRTISKNRLIVRPTANAYLDNQVTDGWIWASGTEEVTHWMHMPEPPKNA